MDAFTVVPTPLNEPVLQYAPGSPERAELEARLEQVAAAEPVEILGSYGDQRRPGQGADRYAVTMPSERSHVLGYVQQTSQSDAQQAIDAATAGRTVVMIAHRLSTVL